MRSITTRSQPREIGRLTILRARRVLRYGSDLHDAAVWRPRRARKIARVCAKARTAFRKKAKARKPPASPADRSNSAPIPGTRRCHAVPRCEWQNCLESESAIFDKAG